ncbi:MAG: hypothetical protein QOJ70_1100 [Acidobacteriota bacterium]|jgi:hypothetical protein|nr:hypothetical protein [Acidobacteriota bacterium]
MGIDRDAIVEGVYKATLEYLMDHETGFNTVAELITDGQLLPREDTRGHRQLYSRALRGHTRAPEFKQSVTR